jgi:bacteriorhodopsin
MNVVRVILTVLIMFSLLTSFTFYYRERPKRPTRAFVMLLITIILMWINYSLGRN